MDIYATRMQIFMAAVELVKSPGAKASLVLRATEVIESMFDLFDTTTPAIQTAAEKMAAAAGAASAGIVTA